MQSLLAAIKTFHGATATMTNTFTGGIHLGIAPAGTAMPYVTMQPIAAATSYKYGGAAFHNPQIQFTSFATDANVSLANCEILRTQLAERTFTLSSGQNFFMQQVHDPLPTVNDQDEAGNDAFGWVITYEFATTT